MDKGGLGVIGRQSVPWMLAARSEFIEEFCWSLKVASMYRESQDVVLKFAWALWQSAYP